MIFRTRQSGLSMIELMVTIVISSFLILGVTQVYIDNKRNYIFQQNQSENQESSRFILLFLQQELAKAGYRRRPDEAMENAFPAAIASGCAFAAGQTILYDSQISICIRYQPRDATDRDCLGNGVTTPSNFTKPYTKTTDNFVEKISLNMANELTCRSRATPVVLVSDVVDLRFEYGIGSTTDPQTVSTYIRTAPSNNQPALAIRYSVLTRSSGTQLRDSVDIDTALLTWTTMTGATAAEVTAMKSADKGQLYQVSQSTVMLRNRMP